RYPHVRRAGLSQAPLHRTSLRRRPHQLVGAEFGGGGSHAAQQWLLHRQPPGGRGLPLPGGRAPLWRRTRLSTQGSPSMIEAAMLWNEPNNKSHWDPEIDPDWVRFGEMVKLAADAIAGVNPGLTKVLGGISPIDPGFMQRMKDYGVLDKLDAVAVHGFPLDWNLWQIHEWPNKIDEIRRVTDLPIWVSEVGVSSIGAEEVAAAG